MTFTTRKELVELVIDAYNKNPMGLAERLYFCKAWIVNPDNSDFIILQSYATIVAAFQRSAGILWVFGFYSNTTAQHIAKFRNWIRCKYQTGWNYPETVRLYNDSRTGKRAACKNLDDDFASVITSAIS
jgi:hypothetical protein|nr:MAG TPA: hypothetical protein [Caudoviricetes sp.]